MDDEETEPEPRGVELADEVTDAEPRGVEAALWKVAEVAVLCDTLLRELVLLRELSHTLPVLPVLPITSERSSSPIISTIVCCSRSRMSSCP